MWGSFSLSRSSFVVDGECDRAGPDCAYTIAAIFADFFVDLNLVVAESLNAPAGITIKHRGCSPLDVYREWCGVPIRSCNNFETASTHSLAWGLGELLVLCISAFSCVVRLDLDRRSWDFNFFCRLA